MAGKVRFAAKQMESGGFGEGVGLLRGGGVQRVFDIVLGVLHILINL